MTGCPRGILGGKKLILACCDFWEGVNRRIAGAQRLASDEGFVDQGRFPQAPVRGV